MDNMRHMVITSVGPSASGGMSVLSYSEVFYYSPAHSSCLLSQHLVLAMKDIDDYASIESHKG